MQYMAFTRSEQRRGGGLEKQAPALPSGHPESIVRPMQQELRATMDPVKKVLRARNIALFTVAFSTTKRGDELARICTARAEATKQRCIHVQLPMGQ